MQRFFTLIATLGLVTVLTGCAHPISMSPDLAAVRTENPVRIAKHVGYHISDADKAREVTTAGGGGDQIRYYPYRDIEAGFYKSLAEVFTEVSRIADPKNTEAVARSGATLLITPTIQTFSSSDSLFTWPPTRFTVELSCVITDTNGRAVRDIRVSGSGYATFDEFKSNFSLAAARASNDALALLIKELQQFPPQP